jgi:hypothetical protein
LVLLAIQFDLLYAQIAGCQFQNDSLIGRRDKANLASAWGLRLARYFSGEQDPKY